jgi:HK97 family phage portal protein
MGWASATRSTVFGALSKVLERAAKRSAAIATGQNLGFNLTMPVSSGIVVTPQTALTLTAFWCGVNVISTDVAKLPLGLYRETRNGGKKLVMRDPRNRLIRKRPNPEANAMSYWRMVMGHALGWGNHYSEIVRDGAGMPIELWPLHPGNVKPDRTDSGKLFYKDINKGTRWRPENILHIAGLSFDGIYGYSPAATGRQAIGLGIGAEVFGASLFGNGAIPNGMLRTPKKLSEQAAKRLRSSFERVHGGPLNANRIAVLEEGLEWVQTQISPDAAQFLATRLFQVHEICRLLNLPPHKLGDYSQAHLANVEESNSDYGTNCLGGWLDTITAELDNKLLFEDELDRLFTGHDMTRLLRGNMQARADYYTRLKNAGIVNADTVAAKEGLPIPGPDNGGDKYLVQSQNIPAENAGKPVPKPGPAPTLPTVKQDGQGGAEDLDENGELEEEQGNGTDPNSQQQDSEE